ncbi:MAG: hypothetical protein J1G06_01920 [Oscillospiraceae bacterium]|nr:hypothetical protein [Oscillospiraceae bacterium]
MVKRIIIIIFSVIAGLFIIYQGVYIALIMNPSNPNRELDLAEYKAKFRLTKHLSDIPQSDNIYIEVKGVIDLNTYDKKDGDRAIYNTTDNIKKINKYLKHMRLAVAYEDELPNQSPDTFITYYDKEGNILKNYIIYGEVFIKDLQADRLYRIKNPNKGIIEGLEDLF